MPPESPTSVQQRDQNRTPGPVRMGLWVLAFLPVPLALAAPLLPSQDAWWQWDVGRRLASGQWITSDPYGIGGRPWRLQQWLSDLIFGLVDRVGGLPLLAVFAAFLVTVPLVLLSRAHIKSGVGMAAPAAIGLAVLAGQTNWSLRGNLVSYVLVVLVLLELDRRRGSRPWVVLLLFIIWINAHGVALLGAGLVVVHQYGGPALERLVGDERPTIGREQFLVVGAAVLGLFVNPWGPALVLSNIQLTSTAREAGISEWLPGSILTPPVAACLLLAVIGVIVAVRRQPRGSDLALLLVATGLAVMAIRNVALSALVLAWVVPRMAGPPDSTRLSLTSFERWVPAVPALLLVAVGLVVANRSADPFAHADRDLPVALIAELATGEPVALLTVDAWATPAAVVGAPDVRTFYDGRIEILGDRIEDYQSVLTGRPQWQEVLDASCITVVLLPGDTAITTFLDASPDWERGGEEDVGRDEPAIVVRHDRVGQVSCTDTMPSR